MKHYMLSSHHILQKKHSGMVVVGNRALQKTPTNDLKPSQTPGDSYYENRSRMVTKGVRVLHSSQISITTSERVKDEMRVIVEQRSPQMNQDLTYSITEQDGNRVTDNSWGRGTTMRH